MRLGHVQLGALRRLQEAPQTAADLSALGGRKVVSDALLRLTERGLAENTGTVPSGRPGRRGRPRKVYAITEQGRQRLAAVKS